MSTESTIPSVIAQWRTAKLSRMTRSNWLRVTVLDPLKPHRFAVSYGGIPRPST
jgi:hypothetical protein